MKRHLTLVAGLIALSATAACAGSGSRHSGAASYHSGQASAHGSAAAASGAASVVAVPIIAIGSVAAVSGLVLEDIGQSALETGAALSQIDPMPAQAEPRVRPHGKPALD